MGTKIFFICVLIALCAVANASAAEFGNTKDVQNKNVIVWAGDEGQKGTTSTDMFSADNKNENPEKGFIFLGDNEQTASANADLEVWIEKNGLFCFDMISY